MLSFFSLFVLVILILLVLFESGLEYKINACLPNLDTEDFRHLLATLIDKPFRQIESLKVLQNGAEFYPAELIAIRGAQYSVHLEAFIFHDTPIGEQFLAALTERAYAGVAVRVVVDAIGSLPTPDRFFTRLRLAGGIVKWYQPLRWSTLKRFNNRTHRELLIIDGRQAFIGGAGIGAAWDTGLSPDRPWRDTVVRFEGEAVAALQAVFIENWLESSGELLVEKELLISLEAAPYRNIAQNAWGFTVGSTPVGGRATRAHILFQILIAAARKEISINSPYFLPDRSLRRELIAAVARGVKVTIIVPGKFNNHMLTRYASRRHYGELMAGGVAIYEYEPGMIHAKILLVDFIWSVVGSTNFDTRSLGLNDEVNLAVFDSDFNHRLGKQFHQDLLESCQVQFQQWQQRPLKERFFGFVSSLIERQE